MVMGISRRDFIKVSGVTVGVMLCPSFLKDAKAKSYAQKLKIKEGTESTTICPYCACGCGIIVTANTGLVVNTEGNPYHPVNEGALCSKGNSLYQTANDPGGLRNSTVRYRAAGASEWQELDWNRAIRMMALRIKRTRNRNFTRKDSDGNKVMRTEGIAALGGAALDNEECYLYTKLMRSLGIVYLEHQARI
jgi:formate dehydrogenase major subunit